MPTRNGGTNGTNLGIALRKSVEARLSLAITVAYLRKCGSTGLLAELAPILFAVCFLLPATASAVELGDMKWLQNSVFRIEAHDGSRRLTSGSGVMVAQDMLVTNCHVVLNAMKINVAGVAGHFPARVVRAYSERDLCLLDAPGLKGVAVTLGSTADRQVGEPITAAGYSPGDGLTRSHGHIEGLFTYRGAGRVIQGSAFFSPGKSGGGLFDNNGHLLGILTFKCLAGGPYHFAVPVEWVKALMSDTSSTVHALTTKPFWQLTNERQPIFVRAASLSAEGDCTALEALASRWLVREPGNPEASFMLQRAKRCNA